MNKKNFIFGLIAVLIIIRLFFVFAAPSAPTGLTFNANTTATFDKEGTFFVNWTTGGGDEVNYTIWISVDGGTGWYTFGTNDSNTGYSFTNTSDANYTFQVEAINNSLNGANSSTSSIFVDTTAPAIAYGGGMSANGAASSTKNYIFANVTATDTHNDTITFTLYNSTGLVNQTLYVDSYATLSINWTSLPEGVYTYNVTINDSATNENSTSTYNFSYDVTNPSASASCSPSSIYTGDTVTCTCAGTDSFSGVNSRTSTSTPITYNSGTYTYSCTVIDNAGNTAHSSASYIISNRGTGPPLGTSVTKKTYSWVTLTPGEATVMKDFDEKIGIKEIQIEVANEVTNVKITVTKYDSKPAEVSVEKSGDVYQYIHIDANSFGDNLDKAVIQFKVDKSWVADNLKNPENVVVFKFNENSGKWEELSTTSAGEDDTYYYYEVEVNSFSYFAISEKSTILGGLGGTSGEEGGLGWWWILIILVVVVVIYLLGKKKIFK